MVLEGATFKKRTYTSCARVFSCVRLCNPVDCSPPGSSVCGILQVRILEWVGMPSSRVFFQTRDQTGSPAMAGRFFTHWITWEAYTYLILFTKSNWKQIADLKVKQNITKTPDNNTRENLNDPEFGDDFWDKTPKAWSVKRITDKLGFIKVKNCSTRNIVKAMRRPQTGRKCL